jgi:calcineurin-like phosphoesterase family protein
MIWFTSDTHYNHKNIVRGVAEWEDKSQCRPFDTLEEHNERLIDNFNKLIRPGDTLYHLGDWSFGGFQFIEEFWSRLQCENIHIVLGNHDHHIERNKDNIQRLFKSVQHYKEIKIGNHQIVLCHYAMRVWNHSHKGSWMLYGHSHGTLDNMRPTIANPTWIGDMYYSKNIRTMDVGVDTNVFLPYSFDELAHIMLPRDILLEVDHHSTKTT